MAKDRKGNERKEYPKLVMAASGKKVRVLNKAEEDALAKPAKEDKKSPGWDNN